MLKTKTEEKLRGWLGARTWHTSHAYDMERWYEFVDQYQRDHGAAVDETKLREHVEQLVPQIHGYPVNEDLRDTICRRISLAYDILLFLEHTDR